MVGRWIGVQNFVGNLGGAVAPVLTGFILGKTGSFYWPFFITAVVAWIGGLSWWFVVGPLVEINWDKELGPRFRINATPAAGAAHP
jgi:MFS family permease